MRDVAALSALLRVVFVPALRPSEEDHGAVLRQHLQGLLTDRTGDTDTGMVVPLDAIKVVEVASTSTALVEMDSVESALLVLVRDTPPTPAGPSTRHTQTHYPINPRASLSLCPDTT